MKFFLHDGSSERLENLEMELQCVQQEIKEAYIQQNKVKEFKAVSQIKENPKFFYSYARKFSVAKSKIGPLKDTCGNFTADAKEKADILQQQFSSVYSDPNSVLKKDPLFNCTNAEISDFIFTVQDIVDAIAKVKSTAAPGEDEIPICLLKECCLNILTTPSQ